MWLTNRSWSCRRHKINPWFYRRHGMIKRRWRIHGIIKRYWRKDGIRKRWQRRLINIARTVGAASLWQPRSNQQQQQPITIQTAPTVWGTNTRVTGEPRGGRMGGWRWTGWYPPLYRRPVSNSFCVLYGCQISYVIRTTLLQTWCFCNVLVFIEKVIQ